MFSFFIEVYKQFSCWWLCVIANLLDVWESQCVFELLRIMIAAMSFLLNYEKIEDNDDSDASSSEDDSTPQKHQAVLSKEAVYKVNC
jgi:hypothetical protein